MADAATDRPTVDLGRLAPSLRETCGAYRERYAERLRAAVRRGEGGVEVARAHARILDGLLGALFCACEGVSRARDSQVSPRVTLVAVGGYGRGLVGLHSDAAVLFLAEDPSDPWVAAQAEGLLYPLWDIGVSLGHAVRGVDETIALAQEDLSTATTLLDLRWVTGDRELLHQLRRGARAMFDTEASLNRFLVRLDEDRRARHERFGGSLYLLEPEVKFGCGGLRDLDVAQWAANARWGAWGIEGLVQQGALLAREAEAVRNAEEFLWRIRNLLHLRAGRRQDRLTFEDQEDIAVQLGFVDGVTLGVEQFMQAYYRHAAVVDRVADQIVARARLGRRSTPPTREAVADGLLLFDGCITFDDASRLDEEPALALRLYEQVVAHHAPPYANARQAIVRAAADEGWAARLRADPSASRLFLAALRCPRRAPVKGRSVLAELHDTGLLTALLPEFVPVVGRVTHDVYHVYTVDVHSVAAVDRLRAIGRGDYAESLPLATRLHAEVTRPDPLYLALLLHDIGKAYGADEGQRGPQTAEPVATRLGLPPDDVAHAVWLVREKLSLYHWATRRDTNDPEVVAELASAVGTVRRLRDLYLLTVAVLSTTNPEAMTRWKARMLADLFTALSEALQGGVPETPRRAAQIRRSVLEALGGDEARAALRAFLEGMPDRYFVSNPEEAIRAHAQAAAEPREDAVQVVLRPVPSTEGAELVVRADDRPGLLADVAAVLSAHRLSVVEAQVYTWTRPRGPAEAFDIFHVRRAQRPSRGPVVDPARLRRVEDDLRSLVNGDGAASALQGRLRPSPTWARRRSPEVPTEIRIDNEASPTFTVVDVLTRDRPFLLHTVAQALRDEGLTIGLAKVNTEGESVADVFYVQDEAGRKVLDRSRLKSLRALIGDAIAGLERGKATRPGGGA
ncbi:MAG: [protein-PII] uridylyltransferase [Sandaracinaceae bacterium]